MSAVKIQRNINVFEKSLTVQVKLRNVYGLKMPSDLRREDNFGIF